MTSHPLLSPSSLTFPALGRLGAAVHWSKTPDNFPFRGHAFLTCRKGTSCLDAYVFFLPIAPLFTAQTRLSVLLFPPLPLFPASGVDGAYRVARALPDPKPLRHAQSALLLARRQRSPRKSPQITFCVHYSFFHRSKFFPPLIRWSDIFPAFHPHFPPSVPPEFSQAPTAFHSCNFPIGHFFVLLYFLRVGVILSHPFLCSFGRSGIQPFRAPTQHA